MMDKKRIKMNIVWTEYFCYNFQAVIFILLKIQIWLILKKVQYEGIIWCVVRIHTVLAEIVPVVKETGI